MSKSAFVFYNNIFAGNLCKSQKVYEFKYDKTYLKNKILSFSLPEFKEARHNAAKKISKINKLLEYSNLTKAAMGKYKIYMEDRAKMLCDK